MTSSGCVLRRAQNTILNAYDPSDSEFYIWKPFYVFKWINKRGDKLCRAIQDLKSHGLLLFFRTEKLSIFTVASHFISPLFLRVGKADEVAKQGSSEIYQPSAV